MTRNLESLPSGRTHTELSQPQHPLTSNYGSNWHISMGFIAQSKCPLILPLLTCTRLSNTCWNNSHLHQAHVYTHVEKHSGDRAGHMKRYGCPLTPPDYMVPRGPRYEIDMKFWNLTHSKAAYYEVVPVMRNRSNGRDPWGAGYDFQERVEDHEVTLDMVWDAKKERNLSKGRCENTEIGIIYEYDLGGEFLAFRFQFNPLTCHHNQRAGRSTSRWAMITISSP